MRRLALVILTAMLSASCATSPFPEELMRAVNPALTLAEIRADPRAHVGAHVVLGGDILSTTPKPGETEIEILARRLDRAGAPERTDVSGGRFLARVTDFLDPAIYARGRRITVLGTVAGSEERPLGDISYLYPIVTVERIKLWPREGPWLGGEYPRVPLDSPVLPYPR
jgi:outer membrane lipoprotein